MKLIRQLNCVVFFIAFAYTCAKGQVAVKTMLKLPDTGQNEKFTSTFGEDADYTILPPYFIDNGNGTVTDTVTGLMWQKTDGGEMTIENAVQYCDTLSLAGYTDWHLPKAHESFSILNLQYVNPSLDTSIFTFNNAEYWWTANRQANDSTKIWVTNAGGGIGNHPKAETISAGGTKSFHVRAVRYPVPFDTLPAHFTDNGDGTITDHFTNLVWQKSPYHDSLTWENALHYADTLTMLGDTDWRLPNIKELQSINEETLINPSLNRTYFDVNSSSKYWSSTSLPNQITKAWYLDTQFGITTYYPKTLKMNVFCVRSLKDTAVATGISLAGSVFSQHIVYPNPFSSHINIKPQQANDCYRLLDNSGKTIYEGPYIGQQDFKELAPGIYFLKVVADSCEIFKLIKE